MRSLVVYIIVGLLCLSTGISAQSKAEKNFKKLSAEILQNLQQYWPVHATDMGVHDYDGSFTDYSSGAVNKERKTLRKYLARLLKYKGVRLPRDMKIDRLLLTGNCQIANLKLYEKKLHTKNPNIYLNDAADGLYFIMIRDYASPVEQLDFVIARMNALPRFLAQGETNLVDPPPIWLEQARGNIANVIDLYKTIGVEMKTHFAERSGEIDEALQRAVGALNHFRGFLDRLQPGEPGSFAIGREYFNYILDNQHFFDFDADSLLKIGENMLAETQAEYDVAKAKLAAEGHLDKKTIFTPPSLSRSDVLDYYAWEVNAVRRFCLENELLTIPEGIGECNIKETPKFLQGIISGIAYQPAGPFGRGKTGFFYVSPIPENMTVEQKEDYYAKIHGRTFRGSVVHEAFPGHHLQLQLARRLSSAVRKWQMNNTLIEGWALYCEEMAYDLGLFSDNPARYLRVLRGIAFRAARIVVDVKLHTGQFSYDQAVNWMSETMDIDTTFIKTEVLRYTADPGQPMSYLMGKLQILELRDKIKAREGEAFDLKSFHDRLLAEGSIPVSLIKNKMLR
ncbi:MAG: DUF885 domain-containing protein [FCB group bacterium]|nr:DUF885 domain-containing protein [FCB group bacterium]